MHFIAGLALGILVGGGLVFWWANGHLTQFEATDHKLAELAKKVERK